MNTKATRYYWILVCFLSVFVNMSTPQMEDFLCTSDDVSKVFDCVTPLIPGLLANCDVECDLLENFVNCTNNADVTAGCVDSVDQAIGLIVGYVNCNISDANALIARCYPGGLDLAIIKPVWTEREVSSCNISMDCGNGTQTWTRKCVSDKDPSVTRSGCSGNSSGTHDCQVDCTQHQSFVWTEWSDYGACSVTCGDGNKARQRHCVNETHPAEFLEGCVGPATETEPCSLDKCNPSGGITVRACFLLPFFISIFAGFLRGIILNS